MNQNTIKCRSAPRPAQDSLLSWFFQWWLNAQIFYRYEVLTSSIRVAINDFYHVVKPEITQMAMTFLYLQYTRGPDAAIWRSWSKTNLLIERPGINWRCPYILLSSASFFPYFFSRITVPDKSWPFILLVGNYNLAYALLLEQHSFMGRAPHCQPGDLVSKLLCLFCVCWSFHLFRLVFWSFPSSISGSLHKSKISQLGLSMWLK